MKCPVCDETLREIQKHSVNVDICPGCKGVWLDRGELEKIVDMSATDGPARESGRDYATTDRRGEERLKPHDDDDNHERRRDERDFRGDYSHRKKKGSWLGEIFESFGGD